MKNLKCFTLLILLLNSFTFISAQELKKPIAAEDVQYLEQVFDRIAESDQRYRSYLQYGTQDEVILAKIDSMLNNVGVEEGLAYYKSLDLSLPENVRDSLNKLQWSLDLQNHMTIRGIWASYGYIPKSVIKEKNYVQHLLLLHPPKGWDIPTYQREYSQFLMEEVHAGRMPAKLYASFYDNILCKILRKPQLYGTNQQFDPKLGKVLPPIIDDLAEANKAREAIGMPLLADGEYRLNK